MSNSPTRFEDRGARRSRPALAKGYGVNLDDEGMLSLDWVREQLEKSRNYWISSTQSNGRPHACPVWGVWLDDDLLCFGTSRTSRKGKNLAANPSVVVHTESGDDVVILEGIVVELTDRDLLRKYADTYDAKYAIRPEIDQNADSDGVTYVLQPDDVLAWMEHDFLKTPTRWRFERGYPAIRMREPSDRLFVSGC